VSRTSSTGRLALAWTGLLFGQQAVLDEAATAFEQGRAAEAGQKLEAVLRNHPNDLRALILNGAVLDSLQRYGEAESYYQRALKLAPGSAQVLNNAANHYLAAGDRKRARELYLKAIAAEPHHANANLQLAQISVEAGHGAEALVYLNRLDDAANSSPEMLLLRARALALAGRCLDAGQLLGQLEARADASPSVFFSSGMALAECKQYDHAEKSFSRALDANPADFDILYNLGQAALRAGHAGRATAILETALKQHPEDTDCLYALSQAYLKENRPLDAAALLTKAQRRAPERADVLLLLAETSARLGFYRDAAVAYDGYLKLKPGDEAARRERGFSLACANQFKSALRDLEWYVDRRPRDAMGYYELAIAQSFESRATAVQSLDTALNLDRGLLQARYTRALLNLENEKPAAAIEDLRAFLDKKPDDYRALAHLGRAYLVLDRPGDALEALKRAFELAPNEPQVLLQYHRVLVKLGRTQEAALILPRLKQSGAAGAGPRPQAGLIDYLNLAPADQRARYLANLRRNAAANPDDVQWKVKLGRELLAEGQTAEGLDIFRELQSTSSDPALLVGCGRILLEFEKYQLGREFLETALRSNQSLSAARLDLAIALFHLETPQAALAELDKTLVADRKGDYYLLRAQILDAQGEVQEAAEALNQGMRTAPTRPALYLQAAGFLLKHKLYDKALALLEQASRILPDDRDLLMTRAVTLAVITRDGDAQKLLAAIQVRWPEWDRPYLLNGMILEIQLKSAEALPLLETAIALGATTPEAYYYQALAITHSRPSDVDSAYEAISRALALTPNDPYIFLLAGKISLARKDYTAAIVQLAAATRLLPTLIPAHYALHDAYLAVGDEQKSAAELDAIQRIAEQNAATDQSPFPVEDFVFHVGPPS
jgi:tetratricopeptide (TPR) repeat protein